MNQAVETAAVETQEAAKTVTVSIGLYNALDALAPGWQTAWTPQQVELARNIYALGMRDVQIFANKSLENVMEGYQSAVVNLKEGSDWLIADLNKPAAVQAAMAAETAKQAAADAAATSTGTVDLGAVEVEVPAEHASDLDVEEQEYQERMNNAVQAEAEAHTEVESEEPEQVHTDEPLQTADVGALTTEQLASLTSSDLETLAAPAEAVAHQPV